MEAGKRCNLRSCGRALPALVFGLSLSHRATEFAAASEHSQVGASAVERIGISLVIPARFEFRKAPAIALTESSPGSGVNVDFVTSFPAADRTLSAFIAGGTAREIPLHVVAIPGRNVKGEAAYHVTLDPHLLREYVTDAAGIVRVIIAPK